MISVLIASMGRPFLLSTIDSVAAARVPAGESVEVIVADDSVDGAAARLLDGRDVGLPLRVLPAGAGNVSIARNACLDAAAGDWLIFVDDDETVEPGWLEGHLSAARDFAADAVFGPVFPRYPAGTPAWFVAADPLFQDWRWDEDGRPHPHGRTGNTLIRRSALGGLRFDPAFGRTGGEDHDFFLRFAAAGRRMVVTCRARAHEDIPAARATPAYALARAVRSGEIYARTRLVGRGREAALAFSVDAAIKLAAGAVLWLALRPFDRPRAFGYGRRAAVNLGKLRGVVGSRPLAAWR
ncbi:glycosyltransferase family 2 protein [Pleomorphomonas koreensis]|uniref:glycosyltransferase family 2 protein n=1 Tax=Pleomorphomonas koreensis TaxID=257440 RepID=UPI000425C8D9|nr:glycosyltransferase family 2 protein [Pleomorphomonas koreensis]